MQSYILAVWRHRLQLVHKIIFRDWFWEGIYTDIPPRRYAPETELDGCIARNAYSIWLEALGYTCELAVYFVLSTRPKIQHLVSREPIVDHQFVTAWMREWVTNILRLCAVSCKEFAGQRNDFLGDRL